jgi:hypothetical protein
METEALGMAHAGTPTDLAKQPATSANGPWQALLAVIVILAIGVGMALIASTVATSRGITAPAADGSYNEVEALRGGTTLAAADSSYTQVEKNRGGAFAAPRIEAQRGPSTASAALIYVGTQRGPTTAAGALVYVQGTAPDNGPGRIVGHKGGMVDQ